MSKVEIKLFGRFEIFTTDGSPQLELTRACQKLFAYLLLNPGKLCRREVLMEVFWGENSPERARSCLNSALWRLRRELSACGVVGTNYLLTTDTGEVGFNWACDYSLDVQVFKQKVTPFLGKVGVNMTSVEVAQLESSLALYRGELLDGIYDDWALVEREQLRLMYINALTQLMNYYTNSNTFEKSLEFARAILKEDPLREDIHRAMMRLYMATGQRALGMHQYRTCAAILDSELGIPPMEETQLLYRQLLDPTPVQSVTISGMRQTYHEMEQQLQMIARNLDQAYALLRQAAHLMTHHTQANLDA
jgi:DNA-binding SARP family transcriptional activator